MSNNRTGRSRCSGNSIQSRRMSLVESVANVAVGLLLALAANAVVLPLFGVRADAKQLIGISVAMTAISIGRSYSLRRFFETLRSGA